MSRAEPNIPPRPQVSLRFSLRKMLISVGLLSVLFAIMSSLGGLYALAVLILACVVVAHLLSTFIGTQLRDGATAASPWKTEPRGCADQPFVAPADRRSRDASVHPYGNADRPTAYHLGGRAPVIRRLWWLVALGAVGGAIGFGGVLWWLLWPRVGLAALVAGGVAAAILGGWIIFLGLSFYTIMRRAWREAVEASVRRPPTVRETVPVNTAPGPG